MGLEPWPLRPQRRLQVQRLTADRVLDLRLRSTQSQALQPLKAGQGPVQRPGFDQADAAALEVRVGLQWPRERVRYCQSVAPHLPPIDAVRFRG